jgi:hypothetical protein
MLLECKATASKCKHSPAVIKLEIRIGQSNLDSMMESTSKLVEKEQTEWFGFDMKDE